jgi:hypothetical protein
MAHNTNSPDEHDEGLHILGLLLEYLHRVEADDVENSETSLAEPTVKKR